MKKERWYKMSARMGTTLSGMFSMMASHMHLIFEYKHLSHSTCGSNDQPKLNWFKLFFICWSPKIVAFQAAVTMLASLLLLYSVYSQKYRGLIVYTVWIFCYELTNLLVETFRDDLCLEEVRILGWLGWVARTFMHCFWMFYVIPYAYIIYKSQKQGNILSYNRQVSSGSPNNPRRKSRILSFIHHYSD